MPGEAQHPGQPGQPARQFRPGCCSPLRPWEQCPPRAGCRRPLGPPHQCAWPTSHPPPRPPPGTAVGARPATPWALEDLPVLILRGPGTLRPGGSESPGSARPGEQAAGIPEQEAGARSVPGGGELPGLQQARCGETSWLLGPFARLRACQGGPGCSAQGPDNLPAFLSTEAAASTHLSSRPRPRAPKPQPHPSQVTSLSSTPPLLS